MVLLLYRRKELCETTLGNYFANRTGFMDEMDEQLMNEVSPSLRESRRHVAFTDRRNESERGVGLQKTLWRNHSFTSLGDIKLYKLKMKVNSQQ